MIEEMSREANQPALDDVSPLATHVDSLDPPAGDGKEQECWSDIIIKKSANDNAEMTHFNSQL